MVELATHFEFSKLLFRPRGHMWQMHWLHRGRHLSTSNQMTLNKIREDLKQGQPSHGLCTTIA